MGGWCFGQHAVLGVQASTAAVARVRLPLQHDAPMLRQAFGARRGHVPEARPQVATPMTMTMMMMTLMMLMMMSSPTPAVHYCVAGKGIASYMNLFQVSASAAVPPISDITAWR